MSHLDATTPAFTHADHCPVHVMSPTYIFNKVHDFQKGIKMQYHALSHILGLSAMQCWYCETHTIASVHGTEAVIDPHYNPTKTPQALLWVETKSFMFYVFYRNLQRSVGHMLIKCHSDSINDS